MSDEDLVRAVESIAPLLVLVRRRQRRRSGQPSSSPREDLVLLWRGTIVLAIVLSVHFLMKSFIYLINSHVWDPHLEHLDRLFFFGASSSIFLVTLFGSPAAYRVIDGWVGMILTVVVWWLYCRFSGVTFLGERKGDR